MEELAQHMADRYQELRIAGVSETEARVIVLAELNKNCWPANCAMWKICGLTAGRFRNPAKEPLCDWFVAGPPLWNPDTGQEPWFHDRRGERTGLGHWREYGSVQRVLNGVMLNPLPYPDPQRLVWFWPAEARTGQPFTGSISPPDFVDYRKQSTVFDGLSAFMHLDLTLTGSGETERLPAAAVSAGFFETLGIRPSMGRGFTSGDEQTAWPQVAILSDGLWQGRFGRDPGIVGKTIHLGRKQLPLWRDAPRVRVSKRCADLATPSFRLCRDAGSPVSFFAGHWTFEAREWRSGRRRRR